MRKDLMKVKVGNKEIWMQVDQERDKGPQQASATDLAEAGLHAAQHITDTIQAYCSQLVQSFKEFQTEHPPKKVTASFGIKLSSEGNVFVVKTAGEASLSIQVEWEFNGSTTPAQKLGFVQDSV